MERKPSNKNPFGLNDKGFLWEIAREKNFDCHLDYGTYDGLVPKIMKTSGVIKEGFGVDVNQDVVEKHRDVDVNLAVISKGVSLPFESGRFDSISVLGVIEHVKNQDMLLSELNRVLKKDGWLVASVPGKHLFSFLDLGNFKFVFPGLHRYYYCHNFSEKEYHERYVECKNGLFGDIEVEKMWHQHFKRMEFHELLQKSGFDVIESDGAGYFIRPLMIFDYFVPNFFRPFLTFLKCLDNYFFKSSELFVLAKKCAE